MSSKICIMVMALTLSDVLLFVGIGVLVLIHVCIVRRVFGRGFNTGNTVERSNNRCNRMSHADVEKLPCFDFKAGEKGSSPLDCVVCLENFRMGDKCRVLPICKHSFHAQCVDSWLLKSPICPICRTNATNQMQNVVLGGEEIGHSGELNPNTHPLPNSIGR